jgi:hypothetical protein
LNFSDSCKAARKSSPRQRLLSSKPFRQPRNPTLANAVVASESQARSALDWAARIVENGRELAESYLGAARRGDWRAAEALMNRIYGKPEAALVAHVPPNPMADVIRSLSLDEKLELLQSLQRGEPVELPVIEGSSHSPVNPPARPTPVNGLAFGSPRVPRPCRPLATAS